MFKLYNLDVICFNEVPHGNWTLRVGRELGMAKHVHVGKVSSANHKDKYKSILSRFHYAIKEAAFDSKGWKPASVADCKDKHKGCALTLYSTHIPGQPDVEIMASFISKKCSAIHMMIIFLFWEILTIII